MTPKFSIELSWDASRLPNSGAEWLEADGRGGYAMGTVDGARRRRYHGLLITATRPPVGRMVLVDGLELWVDRAEPSGSSPGEGGERLTTARYLPDVTQPAAARIERFTIVPWPTWLYRLGDGAELRFELFVPRGESMVVLRWQWLGSGPAWLSARPLLSGCDFHSLHHENPAFRFDAEVRAARVRWQPYPDVPAVLALHNGIYRHAPLWYRQFQLDEERARGFDGVADSGSPGTLCWNLAESDAECLLGTETVLGAAATDPEAVVAAGRKLRQTERLRRSRSAGPLERAARAYVVTRGTGRTIIAGYPWFADWGRDTFIALRGLCLATAQWRDAEAILLEWARTIDAGMVPNCFVDRENGPRFNAVDASLWFVVAAHEFLAAVEARGKPILKRDRRALVSAVFAVLEGYSAGTRFGIRKAADGLLESGASGTPLTWMDAQISGHSVTPRHGKPVEVQALWINALRIASLYDPRWEEAAERAAAEFTARFWNPDRGFLYDVIDGDGVAGNNDATLRPNQILAIGSLPFPVLQGPRARAVVDVVERELVTPMGLRSLGPQEPGYRGVYTGDPMARDMAYHQGTVWAWLMGPFVDAWLAVGGNTPARRLEARHRFVEPLLHHLEEAGLGHISEIADGDAPFTPRGAPFQAWSVAELLRIELLTR